MIKNLLLVIAILLVCGCAIVPNEYQALKGKTVELIKPMDLHLEYAETNDAYSDIAAWYINDDGSMDERQVKYDYTKHPTAIRYINYKHKRYTLKDISARPDLKPSKECGCLYPSKEIWNLPAGYKMKITRYEGIWGLDSGSSYYVYGNLTLPDSGETVNFRYFVRENPFRIIE